MFTIKQHDVQGNVRLVECEDLSIRIEDEMLWVRAFDDGAKEKAFWSGWPSTDRDEDMLYIMNSSGATVSQHRFRPSAASTLKLHGNNVGSCLSGDITQAA